jgi:hypothetical protein
MKAINSKHNNRNIKIFDSDDYNDVTINKDLLNY